MYRHWDFCQTLSDLEYWCYHQNELPQTVDSRSVPFAWSQLGWVDCVPMLLGPFRSLSLLVLKLFPQYFLGWITTVRQPSCNCASPKWKLAVDWFQVAMMQQENLRIQKAFQAASVSCNEYAQQIIGLEQSLGRQASFVVTPLHADTR